MKIESHIAKLKEHVSGLEWGARQDNHSAVGFHASAGSVELLSILLHQRELITAGFQINHTWFRSGKIVRTKFDFDFPQKGKILNLMEAIEDLRSPLCYGASKSGEAVEKMTEKLRELKEVVEKLTGEKYD